MNERPCPRRRQSPWVALGAAALLALSGCGTRATGHDKAAASTPISTGVTAPEVQAPAGDASGSPAVATGLHPFSGSSSTKGPQTVSTGPTSRGSGTSSPASAAAGDAPVSAPHPGPANRSTPAPTVQSPAPTDPAAPGAGA